jgi:hypothetical protein
MHQRFILIKKEVRIKEAGFSKKKYFEVVDSNFFYDSKVKIWNIRYNII